MLNENIAINLLDVLLFRHNAPHAWNCKRNFSTLAFRLDSNSTFIVDGKQYVARTNMVSLLPAYVKYKHIADEGDTIIAFHFNAFNCVLNEIQIFDVPNPEIYRDLFERALQIWSSRTRGYKNESTGVFYQILAQLQRDGIKMGESKNSFIYDTELYIKENFCRNTLTVAELAQRANVSEAYFRRKFSEQFGMSPKKYIESQRMNYAVSLLQTQYYTQKEIAEMCGYSDVKYFRSAFKTQTGVCPGKFKYIF